MVNMIHDERKLLEVWLTKEEAEDDVAQEALKPWFTEYKAKKYLVVVYVSGKENMVDNTKALLLQQRETAAKLMQPSVNGGILKSFSTVHK